MNDFMLNLIANDTMRDMIEREPDVDYDIRPPVLREQIEYILYDEVYVNNGQLCGIESSIDAILAAMQLKIPALVWEELDEHEYGNTFTALGRNGKTYEAGADASGQSYWGFHASVTFGGVFVSGWISDAQAAADEDHRGDIMSIFNGVPV
jgi:hypothetical protein